MFVTDIAAREEIGRAHGERFGAHPPGHARWSRSRRCIDPRMLVEIEADAYVG